METEIKIKVPEGMEIDKENSTFECIKFKPKNVTYDDISSIMSPRNNIVYTTSRHLQKCITFRKLLEVAEYINGDWKPDWDNQEQYKYVIAYNHTEKTFDTDYFRYLSENTVYFSSKENAKKVIEIIGEEELKKFFL